MNIKLPNWLNRLNPFQTIALLILFAVTVVQIIPLIILKFF